MKRDELKGKGSKLSNKDARNLYFLREEYFNGKKITPTVEYLNTGFITTEVFGLPDSFYGGNVEVVSRCSFMKGCYLCLKRDDDQVDENGNHKASSGYKYMGVIVDLKEIDKDTLAKLGSKVEIVEKTGYTGNKEPKEAFPDEPDKGEPLAPTADLGAFVCLGCGAEFETMEELKKHRKTCGK